MACRVVAARPGQATKFPRPGAAFWGMPAPVAGQPPVGCRRQRVPTDPKGRCKAEAEATQPAGREVSTVRAAMRGRSRSPRVQSTKSVETDLENPLFPRQEGAVFNRLHSRAIPPSRPIKTPSLSGSPLRQGKPVPSRLSMRFPGLRCPYPADAQEWRIPLCLVTICGPTWYPKAEKPKLSADSHATSKRNAGP